MNFSGLQKNAFPLIALIAAASFQNAAADTISVTNADELRTALTTADNKDALIEISVPKLVVETNPPPAETIENDTIPRPIYVTANNTTLAGTSSAETLLRSENNGDLFSLGTLKISLKNLTITGSGTSVANADGRATSFVGGMLTLGGDVTFTDRFFSATETTAFKSAGGAIYSALTSDSILADTTGGSITFSNITTYGNTFSGTDSEGNETTTNLSAAGGAVYLTGAMRISGENTVAFSNNRTESLDANAFGGALYITNSGYTADGTASGAYDPTSEAFGNAYGFIINSGSVKFSGNSAIGKSSYGGAVFITGGALLCNGAELIFDGNTATGTDSEVLGGAIAITENAVMTVAENSAFSVSKNSAIGSGEFANVSGGGIYIENSSATISTGTVFSENSTVASGDGASASGGAIAIAETATSTAKSAVKISGKSGETFSFSKNSASVSGAIKDESVPNGELAPTLETRVPLAAGGAIAASAGTLEFSNAGTTGFSENSAIASGAGNLAFGGAIFVSGEKTKATFSTTGTLNFSTNTASTLGENGTASGGAIHIANGETAFSLGNATTFSTNATSAKDGGNSQGGAIAVANGSLKIDATGTLKFSANTASAENGGNAQGGAIAQTGGKLEIASTNANAITFASNTVSTEAKTGTTSSSLGGAIYISSGTQTFSSATGTQTATFSENSASAYGIDRGSIASGGAIAIMRGASLSFSGKTIFSKNFASATAQANSGTDGAITAVQGGAIYSAGTIALADSELTENSARVYSDDGYAQGGAIYLSAGTFSADGITLLQNTATSRNILDSEFAGTAQGGAIYQSSGALDIFALELENNSATAKTALGGAIYSTGTIRAEIASAKTLSIKNNSAESHENAAAGGAIYKNGGSLTIFGEGAIEISENSANATGTNATATGGFYHANGGSTKILGTANSLVAISGNSANATGTGGNAFGGAAYLAGGTHEFTHTEISGNSANATGTDGNAFGGAIYIDASAKLGTTLILGGNTTISGNTAGGNASGIEVGNGISSENSLGNVAIKITAAATVETTTDSDGNETTTYSDVETVTLSDPTIVNLTGTTATFAFSKDASAGNLLWANTNEINVESGEFSLSFGEGTTTLANGFSLAGTVAKTFDILEKAIFNAENGSALPAFTTMTIASSAALNAAGTLSFADSKINIASGGMLNLLAGAEAKISGGNEIAGTLNIHGNVSFSAIQIATEEATTFKTGKIVIGAGSNGEAASVNFNYTGTGTLNVSTDSISFEDSAKVDLGAGTKLFVKEINASDSANALSCSFEGTGTIVFLDSTTGTDDIKFNSYYDSETKTYTPSNFAIAAGIKIESGILISPDTTLTLGAGSGLEYTRVVINGGTLLAENSSIVNPLELYDLQISSGGATLGKAGENQVIKIVLDPNATVEDEDGNTVPATTPNTISTSTELAITETTTLVGDVSLGHIYNAKLSGAGTLQGNVSGSGVVSIAEIQGNIDIASSKRLRLDAQTSIFGSVTNAGTLTFSKNSAVSLDSAHALTNTGTLVVEGDSSFSGVLKNVGTITISGVLTLQAGSTFSQSDTGISDLSSAGTIDFSAIAGTESSVSLAGTIIIDTSTLGVASPLDCLAGLESGALDGVKILNSAEQNLTNRVKWDSATNSYIFLGLNGTQLRTTLYGDLTRENIFRTYDFMRAGMLHAVANSIHPAIFGENKAASKYMRGYLERKARERGETPSYSVEENTPGDFAKTLDRIMNNVWAQSQYSNTRTDAAGENPRYELNGYGALLGGSFATGEASEIGAVLGYTSDSMKSTGTLPHKIDTNAYELMSFARFIDETFDCTLGLAGIYSTNQSNREELKADFNSWQLGLLTEFGCTLRPQQWFEIRPYLGFQTAYSRTDSFKEDDGAKSLDVDSGHGTSFRTTLGMGFAFLPADNVQLTFRSAWLMDLGASAYKTDAYNSTNDIEYSLYSRDGERSAFEFGAYLNWRVADGVSVYGGYTGTLRSGNVETRANLGVQFSF